MKDKTSWYRYCDSLQCLIKEKREKTWMKIDGCESPSLIENSFAWHPMAERSKIYGRKYLDCLKRKKTWVFELDVSQLLDLLPCTWELDLHQWLQFLESWTWMLTIDNGCLIVDGSWIKMRRDRGFTYISQHFSFRGQELRRPTKWRDLPPKSWHGPLGQIWAPFS